MLDEDARRVISAGVFGIPEHSSSSKELVAPSTAQ
jgi:hypothetical protein